MYTYENSSPRRLLRSAQFVVHPVQRVLGFADGLGESLPLGRATLHLARVAFLLELTQGAFEFVGGGLVEVVERTPQGFRLGFRALYLFLHLLDFLGVKRKGAGIAPLQGFLALGFELFQLGFEFIQSFPGLLGIDNQLNGLYLGTGHKIYALLLSADSQK